MAVAPPVRRAPTSRAPVAAARTHVSSGYRGAAGMAKVDEELQLSKERSDARKAQAGKHMRFHLKDGETKEGIILDDKPDFFRYEHSSYNQATKQFRLSGCVKEFENCPGCAADKESSYCMFLTVLDLTPFRRRDGTVEEFSRKLLCIKNQQQKKFMRRYTENGTLRGALISFSRDGEKESAIGNDIEIVEWVEEEELATYQRQWTDKEHKVHDEDCSQPLDYDDEFEPVDAESLRAIWGGEPTPGSRQANARALQPAARRPAVRRDADSFDDAAQPGEYGEEEQAQPPRRAAGPAPRRVAPVARAPAPVAAPRRSAAAPANAAPTGRRVAQAPVEDEGPPFDEDQATEQAPPPRRVAAPAVARTVARVPARTPPRRVAAQVGEEEAEYVEEGGVAEEELAEEAPALQPRRITSFRRTPAR